VVPRIAALAVESFGRRKRRQPIVLNAQPIAVEHVYNGQRNMRYKVVLRNIYEI